MYVTYLTVYSGEKLPPYYIGSTTQEKIANGYCGSVVSKRFSETFKTEQKENGNLFNVVILSEHNSRNEALEMELFLHRFFDVVRSKFFFNESYACIDGCFGRNVAGVNNPMFGKKQTENTKELISNKRGHNKRYDATDKHRKITSETHKGKIVSDETRKKLSEAKIGKYLGENGSFYGRKHSDDTKKKISEKNTGRKMSQETKDKLSEIGKNKTLSEETRQKISNSKIGIKRTFSEEWRKNISKANKGRIVSEETRKKLNKPRNSPKSICPYCGFCGGGGNMKRYHFENCKHKT